MTLKRGRPSLETDDAQLRQRRARDAERRRRYYARNQAARAERAARAAAIQPTAAQLQQGEHIVDLAFNDWDTAETAAALQLRVENLTLAEDPEDARLQRAAIPVDEHDALYANTDLSPIQKQREPTPGPLNSPRQRPSVASVVQIFRAAARSRRSRSPEALQPPSGPCQSSRPNTPPFFRSPSFQSPPPSDAARDAAPSPPSSIPSLDEILHNSRDDSFVPPTDHSHQGLAADEAGSILQGLNEHENAGDRESPISIRSEPRTPEIVDLDDISLDGYPAQDFASERLTLGDEENDEDAEASALDYTVQKLYQQFQIGHNGCPAEQHQTQLDQHMDAVDDDHHGLNDIFNDPDFPSVLASPDLISADRLVQQPAPTPAQWQEMFCGLPPPPPEAPPQRPKHVCLHKEETRPVETDVAFDIDSFLGFFRSLAAARKGIVYQPASLMRQNISTDVHLQTPVYNQPDDAEETPRSSLAMLKNVPHFLLGRVVGATDITVHVLFPHLSVAQDKFVSMTNEQLARWLDNVFHPAVYRFCPAHVTQHLPGSHRHAVANSKAHQVEARQIETASYQAQQSVVYTLQPEYLEEIWADILHTINHTPGLKDFREPQLFFSAKGTKLLFKSNRFRPHLLNVMEGFQSYLTQVIDMELVFQDRFYVDLGKEICPYLGLLPFWQKDPEDDSQVYLWRRCCLEYYLHNMYDGLPPRKGGQGQRYYSQNMLYDASSLTSVTPKRSKLRKGGMIYSQFYSSVKEISDAMKCYPFDNDGLEELALDPLIRRGARHLARGRQRDVRIIERAYRGSKQRAVDALRASYKKSFGLREEHRITWSLFLALLERLYLDDPEDWDVALPECPSYAWAVKTDDYLDFLWRSADKFATGFEVVRAYCNRDLITWEQTKILAMFLRCLRFVFGGHQLERESALWWSRRELRTRVWYGLGFCNTMPRYGYCWLEPRLDWERLTFDEDVTEQVLFGNAMLRDQYLRHGGQIQDFFNTTRRLELALTWIDRHHQNQRIRDELIHWMVHICLQQFRIDVLRTVQFEISEDHREEALQGTQPFSYEYLDQIMPAGLHLVSGNRSDFKEVSKLVRFLFHFDDGRARNHWQDRPFRKLYQRARMALDLRHAALELGTTFSRRLMRYLVSHHWILPYPFKDGLMQTTKEGRRMWYSIQPRRNAAEPLVVVPLKHWEWAQKSWRAGQPPALHRSISWSKEEFEAWMARMQAGPDP